MKDAFGVIKWTPDVFWTSTIAEYLRAIDGHNEANGGGKKDKGPSDDELAELVKRYG